jgi:hypothetical protein
LLGEPFVEVFWLTGLGCWGVGASGQLLEEFIGCVWLIDRGRL